MSIRIKNWKEFQHFKDRLPPWIKLYRGLLDDSDWHELTGELSKTLIMLWLLASEDKTKQGYLPDIKTISFRLRMPKEKLQRHISELNHWLTDDDINMISDGYQLDAPETEKRRDREETEGENFFNSFWEVFPKQRRGDKDKAFTAWKKAITKSTPEEILKGLKEYIGSTEVANGYAKGAAAWLNDSRWTSQYTQVVKKPKLSNVVVL